MRSGGRGPVNVRPRIVSSWGEELLSVEGIAASRSRYEAGAVTFLRVLGMALLGPDMGASGWTTPEGAYCGGEDWRVCLIFFLTRASFAGRLRRSYRGTQDRSDIVGFDVARECYSCCCSNMVSKIQKVTFCVRQHWLFANIA
jgi:hypothetical protein